MELFLIEINLLKIIFPLESNISRFFFFINLVYDYVLGFDLRGD